MTDSCALDTDSTTPDHDDITEAWPPAAPYAVRVRDAAGCALHGEVVAAELVLVTAEAVQAPAVVDLPDGTQVLAVRIVGPVLDSAGDRCFALEFVPGSVPVGEDARASQRRYASRPFWCGIFGNRLASCR